MVLRKLIMRLESELILAQLHVDDEVKTHSANIKVIVLLKRHAYFKQYLPLNLGQESLQLP